MKKPEKKFKLENRTLDHLQKNYESAIKVDGWKELNEELEEKIIDCAQQYEIDIFFAAVMLMIKAKKQPSMIISIKASLFTLFLKEEPVTP